MTDQQTSIDDLLYHEEEPSAAPSRERGRAWSWLSAVLIAAAGAATVLLGLRIFGLAVPIEAVFAGCLALVVLRRTVRSVAPVSPPKLRRVGTDPEDGSYVFGTQDGLREAVRQWEGRLKSAQHDAGRFTEFMLPVLGELVDERLRQRHGLTRASDPQRARAICGDELWNFLNTPARRKPSAKDYAVFVSQLEKM
ncbi:hypothetical protein [Micromonospora sp. NBC_01813]|uniref:hypothetical protein n=1 Tax=Micromonospora sp. NBC_01813 TaxID=2975988 RepID=UPI002DDB82FE|nr:hypothetical protein [Micromonospora sp. NBC_01813]WSA08350.1 hypothetical protein OG958_29870 [Micromonospora sp. NBC_01813]